MASFRYNIYQGPLNDEKRKDLYRVFKALEISARAYVATGNTSFKLNEQLIMLAPHTRDEDLGKALLEIADKLAEPADRKKNEYVKKAFSGYELYFNDFVLNLLGITKSTKPELYQGIAHYFELQSLTV
jgi:hypothetical protein